MITEERKPLAICELTGPRFPTPELTLYYAGRQACPPGHSHFGVRDHHLIHLIVAGRGRFTFEGATRELGSGQGFAMFPGRPAEYIADGAEPWTYCWIGFSGTLAESHLSRIGISPAAPVFSPDDDAAAEACIGDLVAAADGARGRPRAESEFLTKSLLYRFLHIIGRGKMSMPQAREGYVFHAIDFMRKNHSRPISIEDVAAHLGIDRKYLSSLFKKSIGKTPKAYLTGYRLSVAAGLLAGTELPVRAIAHSTGFDDEFHFTKVFRAAYGVPPSRYRLR